MGGRGRQKQIRGPGHRTRCHLQECSLTRDRRRHGAAGLPTPRLPPPASHRPPWGRANPESCGGTRKRPRCVQEPSRSRECKLGRGGKSIFGDDMKPAMETAAEETAEQSRTEKAPSTLTIAHFKLFPGDVFLAAPQQSLWCGLAFRKNFFFLCRLILN